MNKTLSKLVSLLAGVLVFLLLAVNARAIVIIDEPQLPYIESSVSCGEVVMDFYNPTNYFFSFDYREDGEDGFDDEVTGLNIANGPFAGQPFGQRYNPVDVDGRGEGGIHYQQVILTYPEDSGVHTVNYRLWRGAENDWYIPWLEEDLQVESDCEPNQLVCTGDTHLNAAGDECVRFELGGPPPSGPSTEGQVLGASTLGATGSASEDLYFVLLSLGMILLSTGIMTYASRKVKSN